jgi:hypothetical protein
LNRFVWASGDSDPRGSQVTTLRNGASSRFGIKPVADRKPIQLEQMASQTFGSDAAGNPLDSSHV